MPQARARRGRVDRGGSARSVVRRRSQDLPQESRNRGRQARPPSLTRPVRPDTVAAVRMRPTDDPERNLATADRLAAEAAAAGARVIAFPENVADVRAEGRPRPPA